MRVLQAFFRRKAELLCEEIERDRLAMPAMEEFEAAVVRAYWSKSLSVALEEAPRRPVTERDKLILFAEAFAEQLGLPSAELPNDVEARLAWAKTRIGKNLEREVRAAIDLHGITSPIEAIFLIEWKTMRVGETHGLNLEPQRPVKTDRGNYSVDFLVTSSRDPSLRLAVELDGHEFHEKTKDQAAADRARERAIIREGVTVLRFTGSEVFRSPHACIGEILLHADRLARASDRALSRTADR